MRERNDKVNPRTSAKKRQVGGTGRGIRKTRRPASFPSKSQVGIRTTPIITRITPARVPELLEMIRELAKFEHLEDEVEATVESLHNCLFGPQPAAGALLADCDGKLAGYATYFFTFSSFIGRAGIWLDDLYVRPPFRQRGLGRRLIGAVAQIGAERNCGRFEWTVLNWNRKALNFYLGLGARRMDEWSLLRLNTRDLRRVAVPFDTGRHPIPDS